MLTCCGCNGSGRDLWTVGKTCRACKGTGKVPQRYPITGKGN